MSRATWLAGASALALLGMASPAAAWPDFAVADDRWVPWAELGGYTGSADAERGELTHWTPLWQSSDALLFLDLRGILSFDGSEELNVAVGVRKMLPNGWNLGGWVGFDTMADPDGDDFQQVSAGLEALSDRFDVRFNGYLPVSGAVDASSGEVVLDGDRIYMVGGRKVPLSGFDGEVGAKFFGFNDPDGQGRIELRGFAGGYWFDSDEAEDAIAGPRLRLELAWNDILNPGSRLTLGGSWSEDSVRGDVWDVGAKLRIPLGGSRKNSPAADPQAARMTEGVVRDTDIVVGKSKAEKVRDSITGVRFDRVAIVEDGGSITEAAKASGKNTLIIAKGGVIDEQAILKRKQTLQGGGSTIEVEGVDSGASGGFKAPGSRPTLTTDVEFGTMLFIGGEDAHVAGLLIASDETTAGIVVRPDADNIAITRNVIRPGRGGPGILFYEGHRKALIAANHIVTKGALSPAITVVGGKKNTNFDITGNRIETAGEFSSGVLLAYNNKNVLISGNSITTDDIGVEMLVRNEDVRIVGNHIDAGGAGIYAGAFNTDVLISDNVLAIQGVYGFAIGLEFANTVTISGNVISNAFSDGIALGEANKVAISGNVFSGTIGDDGVDIDGPDNTVTISGNAFDAAFGDDILDVDGANTVIDGAGNTIGADASVGDRICVGRDNFSGSVEIGGVTYRGGEPPCAP